MESENSGVVNRRNQYGVKSQDDCYRTVNGERYIAWMSYPAHERNKGYRKFGVRCRMFNGELYINAADQHKALEVHDAYEKNGALVVRARNAGAKGEDTFDEWANLAGNLTDGNDDYMSAVVWDICMVSFDEGAKATLLAAREL